ncbi:MAG TPA: response regulator [Alloacidobacterium sp.]|nr:response regulator [Alloacidobacterium sp.]
MLRGVTTSKPGVLHLCAREIIRELRDSILRLQGYEVVSTLSLIEAEELYSKFKFDLVLVDVEGDGRIPLAEKLCEDIKKQNPDQKIAFVCNYRVSHDSDCPDEIIRSEFNPEAMVKGVKQLLG